MRLQRYIFLALILVSSVYILSCKKEKDTLAIITVVQTSSGAAVSGATVNLYATPSDPADTREVSIDYSGVTDAEGNVSFDLSDRYEQGQTGLAVLDIYASKDAEEGVGVIKVTEEEENRKTVQIQ